MLRALTLSRGVIPYKIDTQMDEIKRPQSSRSLRRELAKLSIAAAKELLLTKTGGKILFI